jgi:hypothetical protein
MTVKLTGPLNCAECGTPFTDQIILAGGSAPAAVNIRGHQVKIPGLWRCIPCALAISGGQESTVTMETAMEYLDGIFGPAMVAVVIGAGSLAERLKGAERLAEVLEVSAILEACITLQAEPGGLDFTPECEGTCGPQVHPRELAHLN